MGKRELGLIVGFIVVGVLLWQVTAPKAEGPGFSMGRWLDNVRREMRGRNASAELVTKPAIAIDGSINELRLTLSGDVTIKGEDRSDIAAELKVVSDGYDEAEAKKLAGESHLLVSQFADSVVVGFKFPDPGRQNPTLVLRIPARLRVQLDGRGTAAVSGVDSVTLVRQGGQLRLSGVKGVVKGESRGGLIVDGAEAIDLSIAGGETALKNVRGDVRLNVRGGEVRLDKANARLTVTGTDTQVVVDKVAGETRAEIVDGDIELNEVSAPVDIEARGTPVTLGFARAATAKIQVRGESLELVLPRDAASYSLDARATDGELRVPEGLQKTTQGTESSVTKSAGANAPSIFVRGTGATITIR
jgi:hypothetical protein